MERWSANSTPQTNVETTAAWERSPLCPGTSPFADEIDSRGGQPKDGEKEERALPAPPVHVSRGHLRYRLVISFSLRDEGKRVLDSSTLVHTGAGILTCFPFVAEGTDLTWSHIIVGEPPPPRKRHGLFLCPTRSPIAPISSPSGPSTQDRLTRGAFRSPRNPSPRQSSGLHDIKPWEK